MRVLFRWPVFRWSFVLKMERTILSGLPSGSCLNVILLECVRRPPLRSLSTVCLEFQAAFEDSSPRHTLQRQGRSILCSCKYPPDEASLPGLRPADQQPIGESHNLCRKPRLSNGDMP